MTRSSLALISGALIGAALLSSVSGPAVAAPTGIAGTGVVSAPSPIIDVRARARVRRGHSGAPAAAILGLFGAAVGAAIATDRYNNYSNYSYGNPGGYGYAPGYGGSPAYGYGQYGY